MKVLSAGTINRTERRIRVGTNKLCHRHQARTALGVVQLWVMSESADDGLFLGSVFSCELFEKSVEIITALPTKVVTGWFVFVLLLLVQAKNGHKL